jgi:uncharacterized protein (DUF433 family)
VRTGGCADVRPFGSSPFSSAVLISTLRPDLQPEFVGKDCRFFQPFEFRISNFGFSSQVRFVYSPRVLSLQGLREQSRVSRANPPAHKPLPLRMICKNHDPVAKRKKNSSVSSQYFCPAAGALPPQAAVGGRLPVAHLVGKMPSKEARIMATDTTKNQSWVQKTPGVCGGRACIRNTRITVWGLVNSRRLGAADEQILENIVGLTPGDLHAAWDHYREHPAEIDKCER